MRNEHDNTPVRTLGAECERRGVGGMTWFEQLPYELRFEAWELPRRDRLPALHAWRRDQAVKVARHLAQASEYIMAVEPWLVLAEPGDHFVEVTQDDWSAESDLSREIKSLPADRRLAEAARAAVQWIESYHWPYEEPGTVDDRLVFHFIVHSE